MALPFSGALFITLALHLAFAADGKRVCVHLFDLRFDVLAGMDFNVAPREAKRPRHQLLFSFWESLHCKGIRFGSLHVVWVSVSSLVESPPIEMRAFNRRSLEL